MRIVSRQVLGAILCVSFASMAVADEGKPQRIMIVNMQQVLSEVGEGAKAKETLQQEVEKRQKGFNAKRTQLEKARAALDDKNSPLTQSARLKKETEFKAMLEKTQKEFEKMRQEVAELEQKTVAGIMKKIKNVARDVAVKKKYTMALDAAAVVWNKSEDDQTAAVTEAFEEAHPAKKDSKSKGEAKLESE